MAEGAEGTAPAPPSDAEPIPEGGLPMGPAPVMQLPMTMTMTMMPGMQMAMPTSGEPIGTMGAGGPMAGGMLGMAFQFDPMQMQNMMQSLGSLPQGTGVVFAGQEEAKAPSLVSEGIANRPAPPPRKSSTPPRPNSGDVAPSRGAPPPVPLRQRSVVSEVPFGDEGQGKEEEEELPRVEEFPEEIASDQVIKEGWLWKKANKLNRWQKRYVRLFSTYMTYYEKLPSSAAIQPDGVFSLEHYVVGKVNQGDAYVIQLKHSKGGRDYQFQANTPWEVELWVVELQEVMEALPGRMAATLPTARPKMAETIAAQSLKLKSQAVKGGNRLTVRSKNKGIVSPRKIIDPVFCVNLDAIKQIDPETDIPFVVLHTIEYLEPKVDFEGLFRLSGSSIAIAQLKDRYDSGEAVDLSAVQDPHAIAGLLKLFFREMPEPLLTFGLYEEFLAFANMNSSEQLEAMKDLVSRLPARNATVLRHVMLFLQRVAEKEAINFMGTGNIAIVFGPNIMRRENATMIESMLESKSGNTVVKYMLDHVDELFH